MRREMPSHEENGSLHFHLTLNMVTRLNNTVVKLSDTILQLQAKQEEMMTTMVNKNLLVTFSVSEYRKKRETDAAFMSPSFYTSPNGYHMAVSVHANGYDCGVGTHLSVYASILKGKHDTALKWPFVGEVKISLLNQLADKNHHDKSILITAEDSARAEVAAWGYSKFISLSSLGYDPVKKTQYLKDDALYFKVSVDTESHKPWLECRINENFDIKSLVDELVEKTPTLKSSESMTFVVPHYQKKKEASEKYYSPSFYAGPNGYHMAVRVDVNGDDNGRGSHVSVYAPILEGKHDAGLKWPFVGEVKITLLNQFEDKNHYIKTISITAEDNALVESAWGYNKFIPLSALAHNPAKKTQYLKDDTLYLRVAVEVANHKPWLQCTIKN